jgi:hypothetical protein
MENSGFGEFKMDSGTKEIPPTGEFLSEKNSGEGG